MKNTVPNLEQKVLGCWLGKAIGGTLGQPFEARPGPLQVKGYDPMPTGMEPNDDLDLQVVWATHLARMDAPRVSSEALASAWLAHVGFPWCEYGIAIRNLKLGLPPPLCGTYDNWFHNGMGAAIRSELWACLAAGDPALAAAYAEADACVDHEKEGVWAPMFLAALQAAAFVESDPDKLLDTALAQLPGESRVKRAVQFTRALVREQKPWQQVRTAILDAFGHEEFTDAPMNIGFTILAWLSAPHDMGTAMCIATNCGQDTDCTAATVGALMGILRPDRIPDDWSRPIGRELKLNPQIHGINAPATLDDFARLVLDLRRRIGGQPPLLTTEPGRGPTPIAAQRAFSNEFDDHRFIDTRFMPFHHTPPKLPEGASQISLPGNWIRVPSHEFTGTVMLLRLVFDLHEPRDVRVMLNTPQNCRVWLDGRYAFGAESSRMGPSPHCAPINQYVDAYLAAGAHELLAAVARPVSGDAELVVAVADAQDMQWLPGVFRTTEAK